MTNARRILATAAAVTLIVAGVGLFTTGQAAGSATANVTVTATVTANCTITTGSVAFGSYDPIVANAATNLDQTGSFNVACTKGAPGVQIDLDKGLNPSGTDRQMNSATSGDFLKYQLYTTTGRTIIWGSAIAAGVKVPYAPASKASTPITVYGRVPSGQDSSAAADYTDTVVATISF
jgi:spore coat protein U-like protein